MSKAVYDKISAIINEDIVEVVSQGGGCIADSRIITTSSGKKYFLKQGFTNGMFNCEANGFKELEKLNVIKTPKVIGVDDDFLLLENIEQGLKTAESMYEFGCDFAKMHQDLGDTYGFYENNYIGANNQINSISHNWTEFYFENRLKYQFKLAETKGLVESELANKFVKLENILPKIIGDCDQQASLLHGDLWAGNYLINSEGKAVLIDPAVYYGHREADLAMTKLFGGFSEDFYQGYHHTFPLEEGYLYREQIYLLYHVLNHLNLFGTSYYSQTISLINYYL